MMILSRPERPLRRGQKSIAGEIDYRQQASGCFRHDSRRAVNNGYFRIKTELKRCFRVWEMRACEAVPRRRSLQKPIVGNRIAHRTATVWSISE
jgi:hypothetical protein